MRATILLPFLLLIAALLSGPPPAGAAEPAAVMAADVTVPGGILPSGTKWTTGNVYHVTGNITVADGDTLTVEPGVEVRFARYAGLTVKGKIVAIGTAAAPIKFTGEFPSGQTPAAGWWEGIQIRGASTAPTSGSTLTYVTIEYGGYYYADLYIEYTTVNVSNSTIRNSGDDGIYGSYSGLAHLSSVTFSGNANYAVQFTDGSVNPLLSNLSATGNGYDAVALGGGTLTGTHVWEAAGIPYVITGNETVAAGASLTVSPSVMVQFQRYMGLQVKGKLTAVGTPTTPITFTGYFTSGQTPQPGWWEGIQVRGTSSAPIADSAFDYATIEYGGYYYANLYLEYTTVSVSNSTFRNSGDDGIYGSYSGLAHLSNVTFTGNRSYAVQYTDGSLNPLLSNLSASGNGYNAVALGGGTLTGTHVWEAAGLPYIVTGNETVAAGASLTISPGVMVQFQRYMGLQVKGKIGAVGTATAPITFTAYFTSGQTAQPGWWAGIQIMGTSQSAAAAAGQPSGVRATGILTDSAFSYVTIEYGGYYYANLYLQYATVPVLNSTIRNSGDDGLYGSYGGSADLTNVTFTGNKNYAVQFSDGSVNPTLANLTMNRNGTDGVGLGGGTLSGTHTWEATGVSYVVLGNLNVAPNATLVVEPGVSVQFARYLGLGVHGRLLADGTPTQPITFTGYFTSGQTPQPGWWEGIQIWGSSDALNEGSTLSYATIAYGGYYHANLYLQYAKASISHSIIRDSGDDGIYASYGGAGVTIEQSQIVSNTNYGVNNQDSRQLLASNNWWGSNTGANVDNNCNPGGAGSRVTKNVEVRPFLKTSDTSTVTQLSPSDARILLIQPQSWYVPPDGTSRGYLKISLKDGTGQALPGRQVRLKSTLGTVHDGGVTDVRGETFAYLTSSTAGEAEVTAELDLENACEAARSPVTKISFKEIDTGSGMLTDVQAPYLTNNIEIDPMPIIRGTPTILRAVLKNPSTVPLSTTVNFDYSQLGIGLTFGPVGTVSKIIPAGETGVFEVPWLPVVSGHYCFQIQFSAVPVTATSASGSPIQVQTHLPGHGGSGGSGGAGGGFSGGGQRNVNVGPGPLKSKDQNSSISKAKKSIDALGYGQNAVDVITDPTGAVAGQIGMGIPNALFGEILNFNFDKWGQAADALLGDPPTHDYKTIITVQKLSFTPLQAGSNLSAARAAAANAYMEASLDFLAKARAATTSLDRYSSAAEASDLLWSSQQAAAFLYYKEQMAKAAIVVADKLDALLQVYRSEGVTQMMVTADAIRKYQTRLRTQGFTAEELQAARSIGLTDEEIEAAKQKRLAIDPDKAAGDMMVALANYSTSMRGMGNSLQMNWAFGLSVTGSRSVKPQTDFAVMSLARVGALVTSVEVGNPLTQTATIILRNRPINLPSDWMVATTPMTVTLPAGGQTSVEVTITPGAAAVQGTEARVAVEGYAGNQLLGGVVVGVTVPQAAQFDGSFKTYLPAVLDAVSAGW